MTPDHPTFDRLFAICVHRHAAHGGPAIAAASSLLPLMATHGLVPTLRSYNWLLEGHAIAAAQRAGQLPPTEPGWAVGRLLGRVSAGLAGRAEAVEGPLELMKHMVAVHGIQPTDDTFRNLLPAAAGHAAAAAAAAADGGGGGRGPLSLAASRDVEASWRTATGWLAEYTATGRVTLSLAADGGAGGELAAVGREAGCQGASSDSGQSEAYAGLGSALAAQTADPEQPLRLLQAALHAAAGPDRCEVEAKGQVPQGATAGPAGRYKLELKHWAWERLREAVVEACARAAVAASTEATVQVERQQRREDGGGWAGWLLRWPPPHGPPSNPSSSSSIRDNDFICIAGQLVTHAANAPVTQGCQTAGCWRRGER